MTTIPVPKFSRNDTVYFIDKNKFCKGKVTAIHISIHERGEDVKYDVKNESSAVTDSMFQVRLYDNLENLFLANKSQLEADLDMPF